jgi:hypothetical protein
MVSDNYSLLHPMIICTVILALLAVLISTEADPQEPEPAPEQKPPQVSAQPAPSTNARHGSERIHSSSFRAVRPASLTTSLTRTASGRPVVT